MKRLFLCALWFACALPLAAQVAGSVWNALIDREVLIPKLDGSEVRGELIGVDETSVTVARADGRIVSVMKEDAQEVRTTTATPVAPATEEPADDRAVDAVRSDTPLSSTHLLVGSTPKAPGPGFSRRSTRWICSVFPTPRGPSSEAARRSVSRPSSSSSTKRSVVPLIHTLHCHIAHPCATISPATDHPSQRLATP